MSWGAGLGIALFGLILTRSYSASIALPSGLRGQRAAGLQFRDYGGSAEGESGGAGAIENHGL
ncbi:hypothetical protein BHS30_28960 [Klebsiella pneumoniae]|nr:hypothetical protein BHS30_28960 [Klebsiella pneumoniae]